MFLGTVSVLWMGAHDVAGHVDVCDHVHAVTELTLIISSLGPSTQQSAWCRADAQCRNSVGWTDGRMDGLIWARCLTGRTNQSENLLRK